MKIGVLSHRGDASTMRHWTPTAEYLTREIEGMDFSIVPLDFDEIDPEVEAGSVDFLLVNSGIYVVMEVKHRISRIATINNLVSEQSQNVFGGVIFTSVNNTHINSLEDVVGHSLMAVDQTSLGGYQMGWREMKKVGIDLQQDLASVSFGGIHDEVVNAVISGKVDVGTVRTGILDSMADEGLIDLTQIKIINQQHNENFQIILSTSLYPEWPFSKLQHTSEELAQRVAIALLQMSQLDPAAQWGDYAGWTVPLEYQPVHDLLKELSLAPYDQIKRFTLKDVFSRYYFSILIIGLLIVVLSAMTLFIYRLHRKLEESKHLLEQHHVQILDSVADGIYGVDLLGNSTFVNKAMEEITGWTGEEIIGLNQHEILHHTREDGSPNPPLECPVYKTFHENKARFVEDDLFWRKDGTSFPVEYSSNPVQDENGKTVGSVVVFRDISNKRKSEEAARQYQSELAHVARLSTMGEMASGLAHELNQPLTAIATNADASVRLLEQGSSISRVVEILEKIGIQARHAGEIIKHLRKFVRKEEPELSRININKLIDEVLLLVKAELARTGVKVTTELETELPEVIAQHIHIDQVLLNLIRNAIDSLSLVDKQQRKLTITTAVLDKEHLIIRVMDSGLGISEEVSRTLFTPFKTTKEHGMGLGLSLSQGIISAHKGELAVETTAPGNTVFSFTLPYSRGED
ncbi:MAG: PhnD/SsuA/transferrin family substrate-binding protein [Gammaproteobacteria bacterium]|nr:PhnD/SsuA/transferrin family substrate-binding protein [Gammaproteobacteria bacterium]